MEQSDLDLPLEIPEALPYWDRDSKYATKCAIYTFFDIEQGLNGNGSGRHALRYDCGEDARASLGAAYNVEETLIYPPRVYFPSRRLRDVMEYHVQHMMHVRDHRGDLVYEPCFFIVADQVDWQRDGVLMVTTGDGRYWSWIDIEDGKYGFHDKPVVPAYFRSRVGAAAMGFMNLQMCDADWEIQGLDCMRTEDIPSDFSFYYAEDYGEEDDDDDEDNDVDEDEQMDDENMEMEEEAYEHHHHRSHCEGHGDGQGEYSYEADGEEGGDEIMADERADADETNANDEAPTTTVQPHANAFPMRIRPQAPLSNADSLDSV